MSEPTANSDEPTVDAADGHYVLLQMMKMIVLCYHWMTTGENLTEGGRPGILALPCIMCERPEVSGGFCEEHA